MATVLKKSGKSWKIRGGISRPGKLGKNGLWIKSQGKVWEFCDYASRYGLPVSNSKSRHQNCLPVKKSRIATTKTQDYCQKLSSKDYFMFLFFNFSQMVQSFEKSLTSETDWCDYFDSDICLRTYRSIIYDKGERHQK